MATYTLYKNLERPTSIEKYNVGVFNRNNDVIDTELHNLDLKNESQDALLATKESLNRHTDDRENPHSVSKAQIGLGNADNTADLDKPVSTAQRAAINDVYIQATAYTDTKIAGLVDDAPENHNTLKKLSDALNQQSAGLPGEILKTKEEVTANTDENNLVSAVVIGEIIEDLNCQPEFVMDESGKITGYKTKEGADTVFPFSNTNCKYAALAYNQSETVTFQGVRHGYIALSRGSSIVNGEHTFSVSNNVSLTTLYSQLVTEANVLSLRNQYYEFNVKDENDAIFTLTRGSRDNPKAFTKLLIVCDK